MLPTAPKRGRPPGNERNGAILLRESTFAFWYPLMYWTMLDVRVFMSLQITFVKSKWSSNPLSGFCCACSNAMQCESKLCVLFCMSLDMSLHVFLQWHVKRLRLLGKGRRRQCKILRSFGTSGGERWKTSVAFFLNVSDNEKDRALWKWRKQWTRLRLLCNPN